MFKKTTTQCWDILYAHHKYITSFQSNDLNNLFTIRHIHMIFLIFIMQILI